MGNKNSVYSILCWAVKKAICEGYQFLDFHDSFRWAVMGSIEEGYVFEDYLWHAGEIEIEYEMEHTPEEWNNILKRAYKNRGLDFESLLKKEQKLKSLIAKDSQETKESKDIVADVTAENIIEEAFTKLNHQENPNDMN